MTPTKSIDQKFNAKLSRLNALTDLVKKIDEASLGEDPQMCKEYQKIKKLAVAEMKTLNEDLKKIANQQTLDLEV